jgi:hypothetical protein
VGYTKLFSELIMSTVWREPDHVRILWITMLAIKDRWHKVNASLPGLADAARISMDECQDALKILSSPDQYSRTQENEGRRIVPIDGGWEILNGEKYRNKMSLDERREYNRIKQQEYREKAKMSKSCVQSGTKSAHTETDTEASKTLGQNSAEFDLFWSAYPRKIKKKDAVRVWAKMSTDDMAKAKSDVEKRIKGDPQWTRDNGTFVPYPATYLNGEQWNDEWTPKDEPMSRAMRASM